MSAQTVAFEKDEAPGNPPSHPLLTREIRRIRNWNEWLERWEAAVSVEEMVGLLHAGFSVQLYSEKQAGRRYTTTDRLRFYFSVADGWKHEKLLMLPEEEYRDTTVCVRRLQIARKAFDMLCVNFFKTPLHENPKWDTFVDDWGPDEQLLPVIQNFFRVEKDKIGIHAWEDGTIIRNLSDYPDKASHNEQYALRFLVALAHCVFKQRIGGIKFSYMDAANPWLIEVLAFLGKLDMTRGWLLALDESSLLKLKEVALRNQNLYRYRHPIALSRPVETVTEAFYVGSVAARILIEHEVMLAEHERLTAIRDAEKEKAEAERKLKELSR